MSKNVPADTFVKVWQESESVAEVVESLKSFGRTASSCSARASGLRKKGVNLKKMPGKGRGKRVDVEALNHIVKKNSLNTGLDTDKADVAQ